MYVLLKAYSSIHPILQNEIFRHQVSDDSDCSPLTLFPNGGLVCCSRRVLMSSPIVYPCNPILGMLGDDVRVFVGSGIQNICVVGMGIVHGNSVPSHLKDITWLTLTGNEKLQIIWFASDLLVPDKFELHRQRSGRRRVVRFFPFYRTHPAFPLLATKSRILPIPMYLNLGAGHLDLLAREIQSLLFGLCYGGESHTFCFEIRGSDVSSCLL